MTVVIVSILTSGLLISYGWWITRPYKKYRLISMPRWVIKRHATEVVLLYNEKEKELMKELDRVDTTMESYVWGYYSNRIDFSGSINYRLSAQRPRTDGDMDYEPVKLKEISLIFKEYEIAIEKYNDINDRLKELRREKIEFAKEFLG